MPFQPIETDEQFLERVGTDANAWAEAYAKMPHDREFPDRLLPQLQAWFQAAINAGRRDGLATAKAFAPQAEDFAPATLPTDDRWFLAYDPEHANGGSIWTIATRCDGGFRDQDGYGIDPQRWHPLPDPQPPRTGWRWPEGKIEVCRARINETRWSGWMVHIIKPDGTFDDREPDLCQTREGADNSARRLAAWSGLPIEVDDAEFDNVVPIGGVVP